MAEMAGRDNDSCKSPFKTKPLVTSAPFNTEVIETEGEEKKSRERLKITG